MFIALVDDINPNNKSFLACKIFKELVKFETSAKKIMTHSLGTELKKRFFPHITKKI